MRVLAIVLLAACTSAAPDPGAPALAGADAVTTARRLVGDRADLVVASTHRSLLGEHVRYDRLASDGTPIEGAGVSVHLVGMAPRWTNVRVRDAHPAPFTLVGTRTIDDATATARARSLVTEGTLHRVTVTRVALPTDDANTVRAGFRAVVETRSPAHGWEVWLDGDGGNARIIRDTYKFADGTGRVYDPNPYMQTGNAALVDGNDATTPALNAARIAVTLPRLDGSGLLRGQWADILAKGQRVMSPNLTFDFTRDDDRFEEVNAYYHFDAARAKLEALGFTGVIARPQVATVNAFNDDNSFYNPGDKTIELGTGGVDDAEDADVIVHEYGHAVQDDIVPGWGASDESGAMGEGFGDILAASLEPIDAAQTPMLSRACIAAWDATSYDDRTPTCLRRIDGTAHYPEHVIGQVHTDGELWSGAVWQLYTELGDPMLGLTLVIESFFGLSRTATFEQWAESLIDVDTQMHAGAHVAAIKKVLWRSGMYRTLAEPVSFEGTPTSMPVSLGPTGPLPAVASDESLTVTHPGAGAMRVHFSAFDLERGTGCRDGNCDNVYIYDGEGRLYGILGGARGASDSPVVPGDKIVVRWVTDGRGASPGFHIDRYDFGSSMPGPGPDAGVEPDAGMPGPDAGEQPAMGEGGGCCDAGRADASMLLGALALGAIVRRRRRA